MKVAERAWMIAVVCIVAGGCRTDGLKRGRPVAGAPVTSMESVEIARQSEMTLAQMSEVDLVEQLLYHRTMYSRTLRDLAEYYQDRGYSEKRKWAQNELSGLQRVRPYHYLLDSELARLDLQPVDQDPDADALFAAAVTKARNAGHGIPGIYSETQMIEALQMFKQLIREYPSSDKIDDAAYYCGELHKEYFKGEDGIAVQWYERAWTWDPATPHPARFQAAVVYDLRLHERQKALELYRAVLATEKDNSSNLRWATERIKQLTQIGPVESYRSQPVASPAGAIGQPMPQTPPADDIPEPPHGQ